MPPANPLAQLQQQIESADDMQLRQALAQPMEQVPQIMLMMEMSHRQNQRMAFRQQPPAQSIRDEMLSGRYNPVPPVGIAALQNSLPVQTPQSRERDFQGKGPRPAHAHRPEREPRRRAGPHAREAASRGGAPAVREHLPQVA